MGLIPFDSLPDSSRLWIFHAERTLDDAELESLQRELAAFMQGWAAHRNDLTAGFEIRHNQFILLAVDESKLPPSGCSIDSMVGALGEIGGRLGIEMVDPPEIAYLDAEKVEAVSRTEFQRLAEQGEVSVSTVVFDRMIDRLGDLRSGKWQKPARDSWHARAFDLKGAEES